MSNLDLFKSKPSAGKKWTMPSAFPRLDGAKMLCVDVETFDEGIGAGTGPSVRTGGYIAGIGVCADGDRSWYFPMRHANSKNLNPDVVLRWAREELTRPEQPKLGHNLLYDLDYLAEDGVHVQGDLHDTSIAEPLIDEHAFSYSLDTLGKKYVGETKDDKALYEWCAWRYGGKPDRKQAGNIWRAPAEMVGPYAEQDVRLPFKIYAKQQDIIRNEGLENVYALERRLMPLLLAMRRVGVRVDKNKSNAISEMLESRIKRDYKTLHGILGDKININSANDLAKAFDRLGLEYPRTKTGKPSFVQDFLSRHEHQLPRLITDIRKWEKFKGTFIDGYVEKYAVGGRIHALFHQLRNDEYGTISGRFSSSNPNLQNIPSRDPELGPLVRSLFVPEDGHMWYSADYSQIEYRLLLHYAEGEAAEGIRAEFEKNPHTDYHALVAEWAGIERKPAKALNFGIIYGMGVKTMAKNFGWTMEQAEHFLELYEEKIPFARTLLKGAGAVANSRGYVRTLEGRRARFNMYEPAEYGKWKSYPLERAKEVYQGKRLKRAFTYSALNKVVQGSAADVMKRGMVDIWESGVCDVLGIPGITVHDELNWSVPQTKYAEEALAEAVRLMENCAPEVKVPLVVDVESGVDWGNCK